MTSDYRNFTFDDKTISVTDEQHDIITASVDTNMLILACAGSGKSTTMVCRTKYLIDQGIDPTRIILTTFNVDACGSLRKKLDGLFDDVPKIMLGTLDSIACRMYHKYFKKDYFVGISEYATELLKFLKSPSRDIIMSKYDVIIFDEFQDINEIQYGILKQFYDDGKVLILIGDDAQNIYQWRGSDVKYILNAQTYFPSIKTFGLSKNYRSSTEIVNFACDVIKNNKDQIVKKMVSHNGPVNIKPQISHFYSLAQQSKEIIRDIISLLKSGVRLDEIAVLSRTNYPLKNLEEEIEKNNKISFHIKYVSLITNTTCDTKPKITEGCMTLTTIHKAKGLEWTYVYFISCDDEVIPSSLDSVGIQEERRLFYVAATRARKYLRLSFTKKTISRFIAEIGPGLYSFPDARSEYFKYSNRRGHLPPTELHKIVKLIQENDIDMMRSKNIIPSITPTSVKLHDAYGYDSVIDDNYLHGDFNNFVTRIIIRTIGDSQKNKLCCDDIYANILSNSITVSRETYNIYCKYMNKFHEALKILQLKDSNEIIIQHMGDVNEDEHQIIIDLIRKMMLVRDNNISEMNTDAKVSVSCATNSIMVVPKNYLPPDFLRELVKKYTEYKNIDNPIDKITYNTYIVALCENICDKRRRLMHMGFRNNDTQNSIYEIFMKNFNGICKNILTTFINENIDDELQGMMICRSIQNSIDGVIKIHNKTQNKIIDIRCSTDKSCKLEWFIELLGLVAILRENDKVINSIEIYNPITGILHTFDVSGWTHNLMLLKQLDSIRNSYELRGMVVPSESLSPTKVPLEHNDDSYTTDLRIFSKPIEVPKTFKLIDEINVINELIAVTPVQTERDSRTVKLELELEQQIKKYETLLNKLQQIYDDTKKVCDMMSTCTLEMKVLMCTVKNKTNKPYYIVFDTETTGLPYTHASPHKNLRAYDKSRILQLSWAVYDIDGNLMSVNNYIIKPMGYHVLATHIHGITERIAARGANLPNVFEKFQSDMNRVNFLLGHNVMFDIHILMSEMIRIKNKLFLDELSKKTVICTMRRTVCLSNENSEHSFEVNGFEGSKQLKQSELYSIVLNKTMICAHNAKYDTLNLGEIVTELKRTGIFIF